MYVNFGKVNNLFNVDAINRKLNQNTMDGDEKSGVFLPSDIAVISKKGKAMSAVERLMKQKNFIKECKDSLLSQMTDKESGYCSAEIKEKIEEYEKQLDSIDEQIAKEMAKQAAGTEELSENNIYKRNQSMTEQEAANKRMANITKLSTELEQSEIIDSVKDRLEGEKNVLEAELKSGDSERKRKRIEEIDSRTIELTKETFTRSGEITNNDEASKVSGDLEAEKTARLPELSGGYFASNL